MGDDEKQDVIYNYCLKYELLFSRTGFYKIVRAKCVVRFQMGAEYDLYLA